MSGSFFTRRRLLIGAMWLLALGAIAALSRLYDRPRDDGRTVDDEGELRTIDDRAPPADRLGLPVGPVFDRPLHNGRGGPRQTGRSPHAGPRSASIGWRYRAQGRFTAAPVIAEDGTIFVGAHGRHLHAIAPDGSERWTKHLFGPIWSSATLGEDGTIYIGSDANALFALDPSDGSTRWRRRMGGDVDGSPVFAPDGSLRVTAGRELWALETDGRARWRFQAHSPFLLATPALDSDGTAYVGATDDKLYAVDAEGRLRWSESLDAQPMAGPLIDDDGTIFVGGDRGYVVALDRNGRRRWRADVGGHVRAPLALALDGSVLAATYGPRPRVISLDPATGDERWYFPVTVSDASGRGIASGPLVAADGAIYFGAHDGFVYCLTGEGRLRWVHRIGADVDGTPTIGPDGTLYIGADDQHLYAFERVADTDDGAPDGETAAADRDPTDEDAHAPPTETDDVDGQDESNGLGETLEPPPGE